MQRTLLALAISTALCTPGVWASGQTTLVDETADGEYSGAGSTPGISKDGNLVMFNSREGNLVANDTNGAQDVFVKNRSTGEITRVSLDKNGAQVEGDSTGIRISADGRFVLFDSSAYNLAPGDTHSEVFVYDLANRRTILVSAGLNNEPATYKYPYYTDAEGNAKEDTREGNSTGYAISGDGRFVVFRSDAENLVLDADGACSDLYLRDLVNNSTGCVAFTDPDGNRIFPDYGHVTISEDGDFLAFDSLSSQLVRNDSNGSRDVFRYEMATKSVLLVSTAKDGAPALADGSVQEVQDPAASFAVLETRHPDGAVSRNPSISGDGGKIAFVSDAYNLADGDTNHADDIFVRDLTTNTTTKVSGDFQPIDCTNSETYLSGFDAGLGKDVVYRNLVHSGCTTGTDSPAISSNGSSVAFQSRAYNLVAGNPMGKTNVYLSENGQISLASVAPEGSRPGDEFFGGANPSISGDGRFVAFENGGIYVHDGVPQADVIAGMDVSARAAGRKSRLAISIGVKNRGGAMAAGVQATIIVPKSLKIMDMGVFSLIPTASADFDASSDCSRVKVPDMKAFTCNLGDLAPGQGVEIFASARVKRILGEASIEVQIPKVEGEANETNNNLRKVVTVQ